MTRNFVEDVIRLTLEAQEYGFEPQHVVFDLRLADRKLHDGFCRSNSVKSTYAQIDLQALVEDSELFCEDCASSYYCEESLGVIIGAVRKGLNTLNLDLEGKSAKEAVELVERARVAVYDALEVHPIAHFMYGLMVGLFKALEARFNDYTQARGQEVVKNEFENAILDETLIMLSSEMKGLPAITDQHLEALEALNVSVRRSLIEGEHKLLAPLVVAGPTLPTWLLQMFYKGPEGLYLLPQAFASMIGRRCNYAVVDPADQKTIETTGVLWSDRSYDSVTAAYRAAQLLES